MNTTNSLGGIYLVSTTRYRLLLVLAILITLISGLISHAIQPYYYDPLLGRFALGFSFVLLLIGDYYQAPNHRFRNIFLQIGFYLLTSYTLGIAIFNGFAPIHLILAVLTVSWVAFSYERFSALIVFQLIFLTGIGIALTYVPDRTLMERVATGGVFLIGALIPVGLRWVTEKTNQQEDSALRFFQELLTQGPDSVFLTDAQGVIQWVNPSAIRLCDAPGSQALIGKRMTELYAIPNKVRELSYLLRTPQRQIKIRSCSNRIFEAQISVHAIPAYKGATYAFHLSDIQHLIQAVAQATQGQQYKKALLDNHADLQWLADEQGKAIAWNQAFEDYVLDHSEINLAGETDLIYNYLLELSGSANWDDYHQQALQGNANSIETKLGADSYQVQFKPAWAEDTPLGVSISARPIDQVSNPEILELGDAHYTTFLQASDDGLFYWNLPNNTWYFSPQFKRMLGYEEDAIPENHIWRARIHPADLAPTFLALKQYLRGASTVFREEFRVRHKKGYYIWVYARAKILRDRTGSPVRLTGSCVNITYQKKSTELLYGTFEKAASGMIAARPIRNRDREIIDFELLLCNRKAVALFASDLDDLTGYRLLFLLPQCEENGLLDLFREVILTEKSIDVERKFRMGYLHNVWFHIRAEKLGDGLAITLEDITARKSRISELAPSPQPTSSTQAKAEFLAQMSHEIRTPMNALLGMTGLLSETSLSQEQRSYLETIQVSGDNLMHIIGEILDYSQIDSGKLGLEHRSFNLVDCVESVYEQLSQVADEKQLELIYYVDAEAPTWIISDPNRLSQILNTLVANAIRFTETGEIYTSIRQLSTNNLTSTLEIAVRDTGIGIPPDQLDQVFQPFTEKGSRKVRKYNQSGLGLAIAKKLAQLMGGDIWIESQQWKGSTFYVTLQVQIDPSTPPLHESLRDDNMRGARVLIVDDNETNLSILRLRCRKWGMEVLDFNNPLEALELIVGYQEEDDILPPVDFAIIDMLMPQMDGNDLARSIRAFYSREELPIIMLTSLASPPTEEEKRLYTAYMAKPVKQIPFLENIRFVLNTRSFRVGRNTHLTEDSISKPPQLQPGLRILLAEDNLINQQVGIQLLQRIGYRVDIAGNGIEVLRAVETKSYDLIFMDVQMPDMDGLTATQEVKQLFQGQSDSPIIIAMTANAMKGDMEACIAAGMDDYISKPVQVFDIETAIAKWFPAREFEEEV